MNAIGTVHVLSEGLFQQAQTTGSQLCSVHVKKLYQVWPTKINKLTIK